LSDKLSRDPDIMLSDFVFDERTELPSLSAQETSALQIPLSFHQERLWLADQFEKGNISESSPVYNIPLILSFKGPIDVPRLESSINGVIVRHGALRTRIITEGDRPFQRISPFEKIHLEVIDLEPSDGLPTANDLLEMALQESRRPFRLESDLLVRGKIF